MELQICAIIYVYVIIYYIIFICFPFIVPDVYDRWNVVNTMNKKIIIYAYIMLSYIYMGTSSRYVVVGMLIA